MPIFCSKESTRVGEPIAGTAPCTYDRYLLIEWAGVWPGRPWGAIDLPDQVRAYIDTALKAVPTTRLQLVRKSRRQKTGATIFIAHCGLGTISRYDMTCWEDLLKLDLIGELNAPEDHTDTPQIMWLVCTHSQRDRCCARFGLPLHAALTAQTDHVWHSSHVGGHRFAPNVLLLPHGIMLGRVAAGDVQKLVDDVSAGLTPPLSLWRGRTSLLPHVQAAEIAVRTALGYRSQPGVKLLDVQESGQGHLVTLQLGSSPPMVTYIDKAPVEPIPKSCHEQACLLHSQVAGTPSPIS